MQAEVDALLRPCSATQSLRLVTLGLGCSFAASHSASATPIALILLLQHSKSNILTSSQIPCCTAHIEVVPSKLADARWVPPGDQQQQRMLLVCVSSSSTAQRQPLPATWLCCQILTTLSLLQLARAVPARIVCRSFSDLQLSVHTL